MVRRERTVRKRSMSTRASNIIMNIIVGIFLLAILYPLWYVLCMSFSDIVKASSEPFLVWPVEFNLENYKLVFDYTPIWRGFINSFIYMISGTIINIAMTLLAAYPMTRPTMPGRKIISAVMIMSMYFGGGMIPSYLIIDKLGMLDTIWAMIIPNAVSVYMVLLSASFLRGTIPEGIQEAARIDGAGYFKTFRSIIVPLAKPLIGVLAINYGLGHWNSYTQAMIYLNDKNLRPLQLVLRDILMIANAVSVGGMVNTEVDYAKLAALEQGFRYSSIVITSVPILLIYPFLRKYFEKGLLLGGIKE